MNYKHVLDLLFNVKKYNLAQWWTSQFPLIVSLHQEKKEEEKKKHVINVVQSHGNKKNVSITTYIIYTTAEINSDCMECFCFCVMAPFK